VSAGGDHPRESWEQLSRTGLEHLLSQGLTPDQVGTLYGRSGSLVRRVARRWGLDCRALRARSLGLAATFPEVAAEFVRVVDGAPLLHRADDLAAGSGARCLWRCRRCTHEWATSVANRTKRGSGCPRCASARGALIARARPARTPPLALADPSLAQQFVANLSRPDRDAESTPVGSHDRIRWRCARGHEWEAEARQRVRHGTACPRCLAGLWTSRLEFQTAELAALLSGTAVDVGVSTTPEN
jgi:hypothetical protein